MASSPFVNERRHVSKGDFFRQMHALGMQDVTIFHSEGTDVEERIIASAQVQSEKGIFEVDTPIYEGDIVEVGVDPRSGSPDRRLVTHVKINNAPADSHVSSLNHIAVTWGKAPAPRVAEIRRLTTDRLHPEVIAAAGDLFADGHHRAAVAEAFKSIDVRVRTITGLTLSGAKLMGEAFKATNPLIDIATEPGQSGQDEQEGFLALFRGAMIGIPQPRRARALQARRCPGNTRIPRLRQLAS